MHTSLVARKESVGRIPGGSTVHQKHAGSCESTSPEYGHKRPWPPSGLLANFGCSGRVSAPLITTLSTSTSGVERRYAAAEANVAIEDVALNSFTLSRDDEERANSCREALDVNCAHSRRRLRSNHCQFGEHHDDDYGECQEIL
jgi:hypothetical protein